MIKVLKKILKFLTNRLLVLLVVIAYLFYILLNRLYYLQVEMGQTLESEFSLSIIKTREIESQRGNIYDRNGYPLAENVIAYKILLDGSIRVPDKSGMLLKLSEIIEKNGNKVITSFPIDYDEDGTLVYTKSSREIMKFKKNTYVFGANDELSEEEINQSARGMFEYYCKKFDLNEEITDENNEDVKISEYTEEEKLKILRLRYPLWLKRFYQFQLEEIAVNAYPNTLAEIEENIEMFPGVSIVEDPQRYYNDSVYFAHIIGYTGRIDAETYKELASQGYKQNDIVGKIGIEKEMELDLKGTDGEEKIEVDNLGRTMDVLDIRYPQSGKDVYLTLDKDLQIECYNILERKLADIIQSKLSFKQKNTTDGDKKNILMKDVFSSLFEGGNVSIEDIELSEEDSAQNDIYVKFNMKYSSLIEKVKKSLEISTYSDREELYRYQRYFLQKLNAEGFLKEDYKNATSYIDYVAGEKTFYDMIGALIESGLIIVNDIEDTEHIREFIAEKILEDYINNYRVKNMYYLELLDDEVFSYYDLTMTLVEQGLVTCDDDRKEMFLRHRGDLIDFMAEKVSNLEITPQDLALDPNSGSIVVTDVNTGEVLALVSYPSYDNNMLVNDFDYTYYSKLLNDPTSPLYPRATVSQIAPGSTYKMLSAIAGLEEDVIQPKEIFYATGYFDKISPPAKCWIYRMGGSHGYINVTDALKVSCNHFFYEVGYRLSLDDNGKYIDVKGVETLNKYAERLGLSTSTGIEIGDNYKNSASSKYAVRSAIGQGENSFTPVQLARYTATIANGGTCHELNVVDKIMYSNGDVYFDKTPAISYENNFEEENINAVRKGMYEVVNDPRGSAKYINDLPVKIGGKTGTAQQINSRPSHGWFTSFSSYEKPEISVTCRIPFGFGSRNPAEMTKTVYEAYYDFNSEENEVVNPLNGRIDE